MGVYYNKIIKSGNYRLYFINTGDGIKYQDINLKFWLKKSKLQILSELELAIIFKIIFYYHKNKGTNHIGDT